MTDIRVHRLRRRIADAVDDIDTMKTELADIRAACAELSEAMRAIRERNPLPAKTSLHPSNRTNPDASEPNVADSDSRDKPARHLRRVI